jgi:hypothetical protein
VLDSLDPNRLNFRSIEYLTFDLTSKLNANLLFWTNLINFQNLVSLNVSTNKSIDLDDLMEILPKLKSVQMLSLDFYRLPFKITNLLQMKELKHLKINVERSFDLFKKLKGIELKTLMLIKNRLRRQEIQFLEQMLLESSIVELNVVNENSVVVTKKYVSLFSIANMNLIQSTFPLLNRIPLDVNFHFQDLNLKRTLNDFNFEPNKKIKI